MTNEIIIVKQPLDYVAYLGKDRKIQKSGQTSLEAIGLLVLHNSEMLDIKFKFEVS